MKNIVKKFKNLIKDMDIVLLVVSLILLVFGLLNIVTASSQTVVLRFETSLYEYFFKQGRNILIGLACALIVICVPTKKYNKISGRLYVLMALLLGYLWLFGKEYQGSKNWLNIGPIGLQPSEFAKPILIMSTAVLIEKFSKLINKKNIDSASKWEMIFSVVIINIIYMGLIFLHKDLGTMIIILGVFTIMFAAMPIDLIDKLKVFGVLIVSIIFVVCAKVATSGSVLTASQASRLDFTKPCDKYEEGGYQICNGYIAINDGGLLGLGIGNSKQISYIPESHTDSVFAIVAEEYGLLGCTLIFISYIIILYRIFKLANKATNLRGRFICYGVGSYIGIHIIVNLGGIFGLMPFTGVPLPFLTYGGSFTMALIISLALVQRVHIEYKRKKIKI